MQSIYSSFLGTSLNWTDDEIAAGKKYLAWEELTVNWENIDLLWEEIFILLEIQETIRKSGGFTTGWKEYVENNPWNQLNQNIGDEKTKKIIKLYCRVNGIEFDETREIDKQVKVTVNEFERFLREAISVKILS